MRTRNCGYTTHLCANTKVLETLFGQGMLIAETKKKKGKLRHNNNAVHRTVKYLTSFRSTKLPPNSGIMVLMAIAH